MEPRRGDDPEPERETYSNEPVFDLGDVSEDQAPGGNGTAATRALRSPALEQLSTLFPPGALSLAGVIVAVLAALGPLFGTAALLNYGFVGERPSGGWVIGPVAVSGAIAVGLGLAAWRLALASQTDVPRTAGTSVVLGALLLIAALVLWTRPEPGQQAIAATATATPGAIFTAVAANGPEGQSQVW
jgi:hypothetical protein